MNHEEVRHEEFRHEREAYGVTGTNCGDLLLDPGPRERSPR